MCHSPVRSAVFLAGLAFRAFRDDDISVRAHAFDFLVHYGHTCLIPVTATTIPTFYVFVHPLKIQTCQSRIKMVRCCTQLSTKPAETRRRDRPLIDHRLQCTSNPFIFSNWNFLFEIPENRFALFNVLHDVQRYRRFCPFIQKQPKMKNKKKC